jgi:hypothetical protein
VDRDRLAGPGRAGDQPVPVRHPRQHPLLDRALGDQHPIGHLLHLQSCFESDAAIVWDPGEIAAIMVRGDQHPS